MCSFLTFWSFQLKTNLLANFEASISYPFYSHLFSPKTNQITNPRVDIRLQLFFFFLLFWVSFSCAEMGKDIWFTHPRVAIVPFSILLLPLLTLMPLMPSVQQTSDTGSPFIPTLHSASDYINALENKWKFSSVSTMYSSFNHASISIWYMWSSIICPFNNYHGNHYYYSQIFVFLLYGKW